MTTKLTKEVARECLTTTDGGRPIIAALDTQDRLTFRVKGLHSPKLRLDLGTLYIAAKNDARRTMR